MAKRKFRHFRERDASSEWIKPLSACSFSKTIKKEFNELNQLSLWDEEETKELGTTR